MAITIRKAVNLNADIRNEGSESKQVASMSASIGTDGRTTVNLSVHDDAEYRANRTQVRADVAAFYDAVYAEEDAMAETAAPDPVA